MKSQRFYRVSIIAFLSLFLAACQSTGSGQNEENVSFEDTYWQLEIMEGKTIVADERNRMINLTLAAAEQRVSGYSGCNRLSGGYKLDGSRIEFLPFMSTKMACPWNDNLEMSFFNALAKVDAYNVEGSKMNLLDKEGEIVMSFVAAKPSIGKDY